MGNPIKGTNVFGPVVPFNTDDIYASHKATYGQGGWRTAKNLTERNAILSDRREDLMIVAVEDNSFTNSTSGAAFYLLDIHHNASTSTSLMDNNNWVLLNFGYGGDGWIFPPPPQSVYQGKRGQRSFDDVYLYICVEDNLWKRVAIDWFIDNGTAGFSGGTSGLNFGDVPVWGTNGQWNYELVVKNIEAIDSTAGNLLVTFTNNFQKIIEVGGDRWILPAPLSSVWPGEAGDRSYDDNYFYVCIQDNLWKRSAFDFFIFGGSTSGGGGSFFSLPNGYVPIWNSTLGNWQFNKVVSNVYYNGTNNQLNVQFTNNYTTAFSIDVIDLLSQLSDVQINNATSGDILAYDGNKWINQLFPGVKWTLPAPLTSTYAGKKGELSYDDDFIYVCIETNTWKRINIDYFVFSASTAGGFNLPFGSVPFWNGMSYDTTLAVKSVVPTIHLGEYGELVTYTNGSNSFIPFGTAASGNIVLNLSNLADVQVNVSSSSGIGQYLKWNGTKWVNSKVVDSTTAGNGLRVVGGLVELGGTLNKNTVINGTNFNLTFNVNDFIVNSGTNSTIFKMKNIEKFKINYNGIGFNTKSNSNTFGYFKTDTLSSNRFYQLPDKSGTVAMLSDIGNLATYGSNGLTKTGNTFQLGGTLQQDTFIFGAHNFTFAGLNQVNSFLTSQFVTSVSTSNFYSELYLNSGQSQIRFKNKNTNNEGQFIVNDTNSIMDYNAYRIILNTNGIGLTTNSGSLSNTAYLKTSNITVNRTYQFPDKAGTFAMLSDITGGGGSSTTAGNGLSFSGNKIIIGGTLDRNTNINTDYNIFTISNGSNISADFSNNTLKSFTNTTSVNYGDYKLVDSTTVVTIDWNNKILYDSTGVNGSILWSDRILADTTYTASLDWNARNLYPAGSADKVLDWNTQELVSLTGNDVTLNWSNRQTFNSSNLITIDWENGTLYNQGGNISLNWEGHVLNDYDGQITIDYLNKQTYNSSNLITIDWEIGALYNQGGNISLDWEGHIMNDYDGNASLDANNRLASDENGQFSILWNNRSLNVALNNIRSLDWSNRTLYSESSGAEVLSLDWNNRQLNSVDGNVILNYSSSSSGLTYEADYSNDFVDRSLIDKGYLDNRLSNISSNQYVQTVTQTVVGNGTSQVETSLLSSSAGNVGSKIILANTLNVGDTIKLKAKGFLNVTSTGTFTFNIKLGATILASRNSIVISNPKTNQLFDMDFEFVVRAVGSSGKILGNGELFISSGNYATPTVAEFVMINAATIDTTTNQTLDFTVSWSSGFNGNLNTTTAYIKK